MNLDDRHDGLIKRFQANQQATSDLAARMSEAQDIAHLLRMQSANACDAAHLLWIQSAKACDDALQLQLAVRLMRHWREFERQRRND